MPLPCIQEFGQILNPLKNVLLKQYVSYNAIMIYIVKKIIFPAFAIIAWYQMDQIIVEKK